MLAFSHRKVDYNMITDDKLDIYSKAINEALIPVGKEYGLKLECGDIIYNAYEVTFKLHGLVQTDSVDGQLEVFRQRAGIYGFKPEDYGKEFVDGNKQFRFIGFKESARKNSCQLLCLNNNKIYKASPDRVRLMLNKAQPEPGLQEKTSQEESTAARKIISYFVAECMEIYSLGEYHENLTVNQAIEIYNTIPAERRNSIKGIGVTIHTSGQPEYTDSHYDLLLLGELNPDALDLAGEDKRMVSDAYQNLISCLNEKGIAYATKNTTK